MSFYKIELSKGIIINVLDMKIYLFFIQLNTSLCRRLIKAEP